MDHLSSARVLSKYGASAGSNKAFFGSPAGKLVAQGFTAAA
jgi:hypothetical protein